MNITTRIINNLPTSAEIMKQIIFGTVKGLTKTAKEGQSAVVGALKSTFTLRGSWFQQSNKYGIRVTPAKRDKLVAEVKTAATWLEPHEEGTDKVGRGHRIAVPQDGIRKRGQKKIIKADMKARAMLASGQAFILKTKHGEVIATRKGRGRVKKLVLLYGLESRVRIKKQSTFREPIQNVVDRRLKANIKEGIADAFRTMR